MTATRKQSSERAGGRAVSVRSVDNWHKSWRDVLALIERCGAAASLQVDIGGWLSARQIVVGAFVGKQAAGFLCFHIAPHASDCIAAQVDSYAIDRKFAGRGVESKIREFAKKRAKKLRCAALNGFDIGDDWSIV